jgi:hypothetical protein
MNRMTFTCLISYVCVSHTENVVQRLRVDDALISLFVDSRRRCEVDVFYMLRWRCNAMSIEQHIGVMTLSNSTSHPGAVMLRELSMTYDFLH